MADKSEVKEILQDMILKYRKKVEEDEKAAQKLKDFERTVSVNFEDAGNYHFTISDGEIGDIKEGVIDKADITIKTDTETMKALMAKEMGAMEAYARKLVKVDASFLDMLKIKDMF